MAGNIQADNSGNILVEFDYNNLIVVDPNKTIDLFGNIEERLVDHENLVNKFKLERSLIVLFYYLYINIQVILLTFNIDYNYIWNPLLISLSLTPCTAFLLAVSNTPAEML